MTNVMEEKTNTLQLGSGSKPRRKSLVEKRRHVQSPSVSELDFTGMHSKQGYLKKENRHGRYNRRYFVINNAYLNYYSHKGSSTVSASIDLRLATHICVLSRNGVPSKKIAIQTKSNGNHAHVEECYFLKAASSTEAASWVGALNARREYFGGQHEEVEPLSPSNKHMSTSSDDWWIETGEEDSDEDYVTGDEGDWDPEDDDDEENAALKGLKPPRLMRHCSLVNQIESSAIGSVPEPLSTDYWTEPEFKSKLCVRGKTYLKDRKKVPAEECLFKLFACDMFTTNGRADHIASRKSNRVAQSLARGERLPFLFVVNFQVPGPPFHSLVLYYSATEAFQKVLFSKDPEEAGVNLPSNGFVSLARKFFLSGDDELRDTRFKLVPRIVEGPFIVRKSVGSKPALIGTKLKQRYFRSPAYLELDIDIGASIVAHKLTQLAIGFSRITTVDLAFVLQGNAEEELPEQVLGVMRVIHPDFSKALVLQEEGDDK